MAQNQQTIKCPPNVWTLLTNADTTSITFEVVEGQAMFRFTTDTTTPTEDYGLTYTGFPHIQGELKKNIADLTHLASAVRMWAKPKFGKNALVYVDHA